MTGAQIIYTFNTYIKELREVDANLRTVKSFLILNRTSLPSSFSGAYKEFKYEVFLVDLPFPNKRIITLSKTFNVTNIKNEDKLWDELDQHLLIALLRLQQTEQFYKILNNIVDD